MNDTVDIDGSGLTTVRAGFIPLVDCAVLVAAAEKGFARAAGIDLRLVKEVSWANIRDKVNVGQLDCAHMLAGMPIAASLGIGQVRVPMIAPMALGINGNAITVSESLAHTLAVEGAAFPDPGQAGAAVRREVARRATAGEPPLTFAMVFPFSSHNYQLRYWLAASGVDPDSDVRLVVIPPPYMVDSLAAGQIDGFCVGEPWNSLAVERGVGRILLPGTAVCGFCPEKVLGLHADWAAEHPETLTALLRGLKAAADWVRRTENHAEVASLLADTRYLGVDAEVIQRSLDGRVVAAVGAAPRPVDGFLVLNRMGANRPRTDHALWLYSQMVRWRQVEASPDRERQAADVFSPDLYDRALAAGDGGAPPPCRSWPPRPGWFPWPVRHTSRIWREFWHCKPSCCGCRPSTSGARCGSIAGSTIWRIRRCRARRWASPCFSPLPGRTWLRPFSPMAGWRCRSFPPPWPRWPGTCPGGSPSQAGWPACTSCTASTAFRRGRSGTIGKS